MFKHGLLYKILIIVVSINLFGFGLLIYQVINEEKKTRLEERREAVELMSQPVLNTIYQDMLDERAEMAQYLMKNLKTIKGIERLQIVRGNGIEEAFQDYKTLKAVEKEDGELLPEWTAGHPDNEHNVAMGTNNDNFRGAMKSFKLGSKDPIYYLEEENGKRIFTYLVPITPRKKCTACHIEEGARGILMISTSLEDMYATLDSSRTYWVMYGLLTVLGIGAALTILIKRFVTRPVADTTSLLARLLEEISKGKGNLTNRVNISSDDEIGKLGKWFNNFLDGMQEMVTGLIVTAGEVHTASDHVRRSSQILKNSAVKQIDAVDETTPSIEVMAKSMQVVTDDAISLLKSTDSASTSLLEISNAVSVVADNTEKLTSSVESTAAVINQIATSIKVIADHVDTLLSETKEGDSTANNVNETIHEVGNLSDKQSTLADSVVRTADEQLSEINRSIEIFEKHIENVAHTSTIMNNLGERSKEISSIIGVISEVADTTNLLALNAAILAAQAGEHGKGFAVVAKEVKHLAERTTTSAGEITELISVMQEEVMEAIHSTDINISNLVEESMNFSRGTASALTNISNSSKASLDMSRKVNNALAEQTTGVEQVVKFITNIILMVSEIKKTTDDQYLAAKDIINAIEKMRDFTEDVNKLTADQCAESRFISEVICNVANNMQMVTAAMNEQKMASERIVTAINKIKKMSKDNLSLTVEFETTVSKLENVAASLNDKVSGFKVNENDRDI